MNYEGVKEIAQELSDTANGVRFSEAALCLARDLPWTTGNDRDMLTRYLWGNEQPEDKARLQAFASMTHDKGEFV
jgi:hypothetical protein